MVVFTKLCSGLRCIKLEYSSFSSPSLGLGTELGYSCSIANAHYSVATYCAFFLAEFGVVDEEAEDPGVVQGHDARDLCWLLYRGPPPFIRDFQYFPVFRINRGDTPIALSSIARSERSATLGVELTSAKRSLWREEGSFS